MSWLQYIATCHCGRIVVAQLMGRLLARNNAFGNLAVVAGAAEDHTDISEVRDRIVFTQEVFYLIVGRLICSSYLTQRIVMMQSLVTLQIGRVNVGGLRVHDVRWGVQMFK